MAAPLTDRGTIVGIVFTAAFALLLSMGFGVIALGAAWKNPCWRDGPAPAEALISEHSVVRWQRSWWPIGTTCEWLRADGTGTVTSTSGYPELTAAAYGCLLVGVTGLTSAAVLTRRRRG